MTTPSIQTGGSQPPVKTCITNCGQTVPDTMVVCIDSPYMNIPLPYPTLPAPLPPKGHTGSPKNWNQNCYRLWRKINVMPSISRIVVFYYLLVIIPICPWSSLAVTASYMCFSISSNTGRLVDKLISGYSSWYSLLFYVDTCPLFDWHFNCLSS